eukprot:scaffold305504_cov17-Prasinocladus_malaysianus.AAC.1
MLYASNHTPKWKGDPEAAQRRMVLFYFQNPVTEKDTSIRTKLLLERPAFIARAIKAYHSLREKVGDGDVNKSIPETVKQWSQDVRAINDSLYRFLTIDQSERVITVPENREVAPGTYTFNIEPSPGLFTDLKIFKMAYSLWTGFPCELGVPEASTLAKLGYHLPTSKNSRHKMCVSCGNKAQAGCCAEYDPLKRVSTPDILNMSITWTLVQSTTAPRML